MAHTQRWTMVFGLTCTIATLTGCIGLIPPGDVRLSPHQGVPPVQPAQSQVVFFWLPDGSGGEPWPILERGKMIGALQKGTYFSYPVAPGTHAFLIDFYLANRQTVIFAQPGKTYFVEFALPRFQQPALFQVVPTDVAIAYLGRLSLIEWTNREHPCCDTTQETPHTSTPARSLSNF